MTLNSIKADQVFGQHLKGRDGENGFSPVVVDPISYPGNIARTFREATSVPVLCFNVGAKLVDVPASSFHVQNCRINPTVRWLQAFCHEEVELEVTNCNVGHATCCDGIDMMTHDGNWRSGCPCHAVKKTVGHGVFDLSLNVKIKSEEEIISATHFSSRSFINLMMTAGIPLAIDQMMLECTAADMKIATSRNRAPCAKAAD
mmetsp:Transcript_1754/g.3850  ORF Transcript_1754/g.3850 Transcript_1754/m.3850 type:complete len:202 (+) Transcript_1754:1272-1877(+)